MSTKAKVDIRIKRYDEIVKYLSEMGARGVDLSNVFKAFVPKYQNIVNKDWELQGKQMGKRWKGLSPLYKKWKLYMYRKGLSASKKADLIIDGKLKKAATGGLGWFQEIGKAMLKMGIKGIPHANIHQEGGTIPAHTITITEKMRAFFWFMYYETKDTMYRAMALTKKTSFHIKAVKMPQRPYLKSYDKGIPGEAIQIFIDMVEDYVIRGKIQ
jgi:hypothetical protein